MAIYITGFNHNQWIENNVIHENNIAESIENVG